MPDSHQGYGMPIGGVLATKDVVIPNAVGVDIGCGMLAVKTSLTEISKEKLRTIVNKIKKTIPVGFRKHPKEQKEFSNFDANINLGYVPDICIREYENASKSIGTLGGGNHFIEIQKGSDGFIYIMIHSGSRNLGKQVADYYNKIAIELNKKWHTIVPKECDLAFLPIDSNYGINYMHEMTYCVEYALSNRIAMMDKVTGIFQNETSCKNPIESINIAHNYARLENHFGKNVIVHRKGATSARENETVIIPGSQGTKSFIGKGYGCRESFESCSHGAGRKMGRKKAQQLLELDYEKRKMDEKGIIHDMKSIKDLDEAPGAYKDIDNVMANQNDLVKIEVELTPLAVIKG